jgi:hypothetical protein
MDSNWIEKERFGGTMTPRVSRRIDLSATDATVNKMLAIHPINPVIIARRTNGSLGITTPNVARKLMVK